MAERSLVERKLEVSKELIQGLKAISAPLLAAYWELASERDRWSFYLVPKSIPDERKLVDAVSRIMITAPYRSVFSLSDVYVDAHQIERARAIGAYLRSGEPGIHNPDLARRESVRACFLFQTTKRPAIGQA